MKWTLVLMALSWVVGALAQPGLPSLLITLAEDREALRPLEREVQVVQYFRERQTYINADGSWLGPLRSMPIQSGPMIRDELDGWIVYRPSEGMAASYMLITSGIDSMRIELPEGSSKAQMRAMQRSNADTPEVIRFRPGVFVLEETVFDPWPTQAAARLAQRIKHASTRQFERDVEEDKQRRQLEERLRMERQRAARDETERGGKRVKQVEREAPPEMPQDEERRRTPRVEIERHSADTVWLVITGHIMLDGGCASHMPLFGLEMHTSNGWMERFPLAQVQMDCGLPWGYWQEERVMLPPLRWWVGAHQPAGSKELLPGRYRLVFMGGDGAVAHTKPFELR